MGLPAEHLSSVPTIDEIIATPALAAVLPPSLVRELSWKCLAALNALHAAAATAPAPSPVHEAEQMVSISELAEKLGVSEAWIWKNMDKLPPRRNLGGSVAGWRLVEIENWIKTRPKHVRVARGRPRGVKGRPGGTPP